MTTGEKIKARRELLGMSQQELALKVGYSDRSSIAKIEAGKVDLSESKVKSFCRVLGMSASDFFGVEQEAEDSELADLLQELRTRPEMRMLFRLAKAATAEDVRQTVKIIEALRKDG